MTLSYVAAFVAAITLACFFVLVTAVTTVPHGARVRLRMARARLAAVLVGAALVAGCDGGWPPDLTGGAGASGGGDTTGTGGSAPDAGSPDVAVPDPCSGLKDGLLCDLPNGTKGECMAGACVDVPGACKLAPCPASSYQAPCSPNDGNTACCDGVLPVLVCSMPSGILLATCPASCASGRCTVSEMGTVTCCNPSAGAYDPCQVRTS